jgi:hypothetical protein
MQIFDGLLTLMRNRGACRQKNRATRSGRVINKNKTRDHALFLAPNQVMQQAARIGVRVSRRGGSRSMSMMFAASRGERRRYRGRHDGQNEHNLAHLITSPFVKSPRAASSCARYTCVKRDVKAAHTDFDAAGPTLACVRCSKPTSFPALATGRYPRINPDQRSSERDPKGASAVPRLRRRGQAVEAG